MAYLKGCKNQKGSSPCSGFWPSRFSWPAAPWGSTALTLITEIRIIMEATLITGITVAEVITTIIITEGDTMAAAITAEVTMADTTVIPAAITTRARLLPPGRADPASAEKFVFSVIYGPAVAG